MANNPLFVGKYRLIEEIASGSYGRVYRAADTSRQDAVVAIKLMQSSRLSSAQECNGFLQEAQFLKMLQHPYILSVLDMGVESAIPYIVTEFAPLNSLLDRQKKLAPRPLPVAEVMKILSQIGQALQYAHQQNIIHRDLKPANILFNADGDALLADFGIATMLAASIKYGTAIGTPYYMAPEQFRGSISKEGDQYALGCIAYELFTGRLPFTAPDFFALGFKHMSEVPLAPTQLNLLLPRSVEQAILKAMAKQRSDRHADIAAFLLALGVPSSVSSTSSTPPTFPAPIEEQSFVAPAPVTYQSPAHTSLASAHEAVEAHALSQSEPDEQEAATAVYAIYSKKQWSERRKLRPPTTPSTASPASHNALPWKGLPPTDTLPRVIEDPAPGQRMLTLPPVITSTIAPVIPAVPMAPRPALVEEAMIAPFMQTPSYENSLVIPTSYPAMSTRTQPSMSQAVPYTPFPIPPSTPPFIPPFASMPPQTPDTWHDDGGNSDDLPNPLFAAK